MKYEVTIEQTAWRRHTVLVEAETEDEANDKAQDTDANDISSDWIIDSGYTIDDICEH